MYTILRKNLKRMHTIQRGLRTSILVREFLIRCIPTCGRQGRRHLSRKIKNTLQLRDRPTMFFLIKNQLRKLCVILRSRVLRGVYTLVKDTGR